ncbi:MAG: response regulator [Elusimicrobiota bacterium]
MKKIFVVDDNLEILAILNRLFAPPEYLVTGVTNAEEAWDKIGVEKPDLLILDVILPGMNGFQFCRRLKENVYTTFIPIIMLTEKRETDDRIAGIKYGADDYLPKPFDLEELKVRVDGLIERSSRTLSANPLTKLPGNVSIENEIKKRIEKEQKLAVAYLDVDNFKSYNDLYGYQKGDEVIKAVAGILLEVKEQYAGTGCFVGHIGGDDFILIAEPGNIDEICEKLKTLFDQRIADYYCEEDRRKGYIITRDRLGNMHQYPLMSVSIAVSTNERRKITHYAQVVEITSELKKYAKSLPDRQGSVVVKDRRTN